MTDFARLAEQAGQLVKLCTARRLKLATAESCTGGLVAGLITETPGASVVFECGFVTYSDAAKTALLGVPAGLIASEGAVSEKVARAMAEGALARSQADLVVAVTGVAGPGGGSAEKPVGLVHFAAARRDGMLRHQVHVFEDFGRQSIRFASVSQALSMLSEIADARP